MRHGQQAALSYIRHGKLKKFYGMCERIDINNIPMGEPEVQFLIDTTGSALIADSWYDADPEVHIAARADLVVDSKTFGSNMRHHLAVMSKRFDQVQHWVIDYKSGKTALQQDPYADQMATLALARWLCVENPTHLPEPIGVAIAAIATDSGEIFWKAGVYQEHVLAKLLRKHRRVHLEVLETRAEWRDGIEPKFLPGTWCHKCSAQLECDAYKAHDVVGYAKLSKFAKHFGDP